jgi:hypothetical protein
LPIDLSDCTTEEASFTPAVSREFALSLVLRTAAADDEGESLPADAFPDNAIAESLKTELFDITWLLSSEGQSDISGSVTEKDLHTRINSEDVRYVFGDRKVPLKANRNYKLVIKVVGSSIVLNDFDPEFVVQTSSPLEGHPLARWRLRDTGLLLFLGGSLISLGLSKRYSDRKRRRAAVARAAASGEDGSDAGHPTD